METSWVLWLIIGIIIFSVIGFLLKSFVRVVLIFIVAAFIFKLAFVWDTNEISQYLMLDTIIRDEHQEIVNKGIAGFVEKRESNEIIDTDAIENLVEEGLKNKSKEIKNEIDSTDKDKLLADLETKIEASDISGVANKIDLLIQKYKN